MAPIVAPGIARFALHQSLFGREVVNILDMAIDTTGSTQSRPDALEAQAGTIIDQWATNVLPYLVNDMTFDSVSWVDLDELSGTTGERSSTGSHSLPLNGGITTAPQAGSVCLLVRKVAQSARGIRNGRMYVSGQSEADTDDANGNNLEPTAVSFWNGKWATFLSGINITDTIGTGHGATLVIVHTVDGVFTSASEVTDLIPQSLLATQRRRLRP